MPSTVSSSVAMVWESSTVMTPSLPTLSMASAISSPIFSSWDEMAAMCATSSWPFTATATRLISSTTASTARSMPVLRIIGLAPAVTLRKPSLIMVWARIVAVVVPSPATSLVLVATSRSSCAPVFSQGSLSSISRTMVTPSLVTVGAPNFFSSTTLRPLGPRVMRTDCATVSMPFLRPCRASTSKCTAFAMLYLLALFLGLGLGLGAVAGDHGEDVLLRDDQVLDVLQLELVAGVLGVQHLVADLQLHRDLGPVVQDPAGADGLDDALLGLLLGGVRQDDPALRHLFPFDGLYDHTIAQRPQIHGLPSSACIQTSTRPWRVLSTQWNRVLIMNTRCARFQHLGPRGRSPVEGGVGDRGLTAAGVGPGGRDHGRVVGAEGQRRDGQACAGPHHLGGPRPQQAVGGHPAADHHLGRRPRPDGRLQLGQEGLHHRVFEGGRQVHAGLTG